MSRPVTLLSEQRSNIRERLVVRWVETDSGTHRLEIAVERGSHADGWKVACCVSASPGETFRLHDAIGAACWHAMQARK